MTSTASPTPPASPPAGITDRPLAGDADMLCVRSFLSAMLPRTPLGWNWDVRRWDGQCYYRTDPAQPRPTLARTHLWFNADGQLVGAVCPEGSHLGEAFLQLDPDYMDLQPAMLAWAEANLAARQDQDDGYELDVFVFDYDEPRISLLTARGYTQRASWSVLRRRVLGLRLPPVPDLPAGYTLRPVRPDDLADGQQVADILNAAFNRTFHTGSEYKNFSRDAPSVVPGLDLAAVTADGRFAAYVGVPYDPANRRGMFEPVCTHPDHQRRGLARALMLAGLHRLRALGATDVTVETGDMVPANRLYAGLGFNEAQRGHVWRKRF